MSQQTFNVTGLHCQSCVRIVTQALTSLPTVSTVDIDLVSDGMSTVRIDATDALTAEQVQAALDEEGEYSVA